MSAAKHTPGPWMVTPESETVHGWSHEGEALIVVYELGTNENDHRLIAAAPELLEALASILEDMDSDYGTNYDYAKARAAIAKATGTAPGMFDNDNAAMLPESDVKAMGEQR